MEKLEKNWIKQIQRTYQNISDLSHTCSTRRNSRNYWNNENRTMKVLNQWLDEQLKAGLIMESKSKYATSCFYIPKKDRSL